MFILGLSFLIMTIFFIKSAEFLINLKQEGNIRLINLLFASVAILAGTSTFTISLSCFIAEFIK